MGIRGCMNKEKHDFIVTFSTQSRRSYDEITYVLAVDITSFGNITYGNEKFLKKDEIDFLNNHVYPTFDIFEEVMREKIRTGKYYILDNKHYDFHLSSAWSGEVLINKITRRLDSIPYVIDPLGRYKIRWDHLK